MKDKKYCKVRDHYTGEYRGVAHSICNRTKCKYGLDDKKCESYKIKYKYCDSFLEYTNFKDDLT